MNFLKILRSMEEFLYEVMTWLIFYPRTLWLIIKHPLQMIEYSDDEQSDEMDEQYTDSLSPLLFLLISIVITHVLEMIFKARLEQPKSELVAFFSNADESVILFRTIVYSLYPLLFSIELLKRRGISVDRTTLRAPFFNQCYLAALFALLTSIAAIMGRAKVETITYTGTALAVLTLIWFLVIQSAWFRKELVISRGKALWIAIATFFKATLINSLLTAMIFA